MIFHRLLGLIVLAVFVSAGKKHTDLDERFERWREEFGDSSSSDSSDHEDRKRAFTDNFNFIKEHNERYERGEVAYRLDLNKLACLRDDEFKQRKGLSHGRHHGDEEEEVAPTHFKPKMLAYSPSLDWRDKGCITPIKDQQKCASCYAFGSIAALESHYCINTGELVSFSEQQIMDCTFGYGNKGCNNGKPSAVFRYVGEKAKMCTVKSYPYRMEADKNKCKSKTCKDYRKVKLKSPYYYSLPKKDVNSMMTALREHGPIACEFAAERSFSFYTEGVYTGDSNCTEGKKRDHVLEVIGYGTDKASKLQYWLVKNSWSDTWGMKGFVKIRRGKNVCGIETACRFPKFADDSSQSSRSRS